MQIIKNMGFRPANTLSDTLIVRRLRNECRTYLTNHTKYISVLSQIRWYFSYYRKAAPSKKYRIYIAHDKNVPIGYGALRLRDKQLYVTECVAPEYRGRGYGAAILKQLISIAHREKLPLVAEILITNKTSIGLHTKCGFVLKSKREGINKYVN